MKIIASVLSILSPVRFLIVGFTCALLLLSSAFPAFAIDSYQSNPTEGTTQLLDIQRKTDEAAKEPPAGLKKVQKESNKGLNEVQEMLILTSRSVLRIHRVQPLWKKILRMC